MFDGNSGLYQGAEARLLRFAVGAWLPDDGCAGQRALFRERPQETAPSEQAGGLARVL
jgi:hypothetical protein